MPARSTPQAPSCGLAACVTGLCAAAARCCAEKAGTAPAASAATAAPQRAIVLIILKNPTPRKVGAVYALRRRLERSVRRTDKRHGGGSRGHAPRRKPGTSYGVGSGLRLRRRR